MVITPKPTKLRAPSMVGTFRGFQNGQKPNHCECNSMDTYIAQELCIMLLNDWAANKVGTRRKPYNGGMYRV